MPKYAQPKKKPHLLIDLFLCVITGGLWLFVMARRSG